MKNLFLICAVLLFSITVQSQIGQSVSSILESEYKKDNKVSIITVDEHFSAIVSESETYTRYFLFRETSSDVLNNIIVETIVYVASENMRYMISILNSIPNVIYEELWYWHEEKYKLPNGRTISVIHDADVTSDGSEFYVHSYKKNVGR